MFESLIKDLNEAGGSVRAYDACGRAARARITGEPRNAAATNRSPSGCCILGRIRESEAGCAQRCGGQACTHMTSRPRGNACRNRMPESPMPGLCGPLDQRRFQTGPGSVVDRIFIT